MGRMRWLAGDTEYHSLGKTSLCLTITGKGSLDPRDSQVPMGRAESPVADTEYHSLGKTSYHNCKTLNVHDDFIFA